MPDARAVAAIARPWSASGISSMTGRPTSSSGRHPSIHSTDGDTHVNRPAVVAKTTSDTFSANVRNRISDTSNARRVRTFISMFRSAST